MRNFERYKLLNVFQRKKGDDFGRDVSATGSTRPSIYSDGITVMVSDIRNGQELEEGGDGGLDSLGLVRFLFFFCDRIVNAQEYLTRIWEQLN